ncbi:MAG: PD-(D/E)XK nuclease superfamily protein [Microgenomates bacterium OLB23]|nr:MAG: PD-(D/E)XK nuclease superfamily protein [Microgenomates bacterium OLB23]
MDEDKFKAVWISYSSLSDFAKCPRAYYLNNLYKNPKSGKKIALTNPFLSLGQAVHATLESLSVLPVEERFTKPLTNQFDDQWKKVSGKQGGFVSVDQEAMFKERGRLMIEKVNASPGPLQNKAIKPKDDLPHYWLSKEEGIILCGKIDWMEYLERDDAIHIIDFKTGRRTEPEGSLQLPIYYLLATNTQSRPVHKMSYWYLDDGVASDIVGQELPNSQQAEKDIMTVALRIKLARKTESF